MHRLWVAQLFELDGGHGRFWVHTKLGGARHRGHVRGRRPVRAVGAWDGVLLLPTRWAWRRAGTLHAPQDIGGLIGLALTFFLAHRWASFSDWNSGPHAVLLLHWGPVRFCRRRITGT